MTDRPARKLDAPPLGPGSDKHERPTVRPLAKIHSFMRETSAPESDSERGFPAAPITQRRLKGSEEEWPCTEPARIVTIDSSARPSKTHHTIDDPIAEMRERFSFRDYEGALALADCILAEWPDHALAREFRANCCAALEDVYAFRLGETAASHPMSDRERKLTAAIYAQLSGVVDQVRRNGKLPPRMTAARGAEIGLRVLVQERGLDIELSENERLVFDAITASGDAPAGCAVLL